MYEKSNDIITNSEEKNPISKDVEILTRDISKYYYINKLKELLTGEKPEVDYFSKQITLLK